MALWSTHPPGLAPTAWNIPVMQAGTELGPKDGAGEAAIGFVMQGRWIKMADVPIFTCDFSLPTRVLRGK